MNKDATMLAVKVRRLDPNARIPAYSHTGALGDLAADLYAVEDATIDPQQVRNIPTGIALEIPSGFGAIVEDRSGLALRGITTLAGVIDSGYRGEIRVVIANVGSAPYQIRRGDRIAQLRFVQRITATFAEADTLGESERAERGFGSTGK